MKRLFIAIAAALLVGAALGAGSSTFGQGTEGSGQVFTWVEEGKVRKVWLNPNLIAEFNPAAGPSAPGTGVRQAKELSGSGPTIRFWALDAATPLEVGMSMMKSAHPTGAFSPVFHANPGGGAKMALPGNVIVFLDPDWSPGQASAWAQANGLTVVSQLGFGKNLFLIASPPGLETLAAANAISALEGVVQAVPNWWNEPFTR